MEVQVLFVIEGAQIERTTYSTFSLTISTPLSSASSILVTSVPPPCAIPGFPRLRRPRALTSRALSHPNRPSFPYHISFSLNNISNTSSRNSSGVASLALSPVVSCASGFSKGCRCQLPPTQSLPITGCSIPQVHNSMCLKSDENRTGYKYYLKSRFWL